MKGTVEVYVRTPVTRVPDDGRTFVISVVLVNGLGHAFPVAGACSGWLAAGLASATIRFQPAYSAVGCPDDSISPGTTRLARTVATTYESCSQDPSAAPNPGTPTCLGTDHDQMPNLPAGRYRLTLDTSSVPHPVIATPVVITLSTA